MIFHPNFNHQWKYFITSCWRKKVGVLANGWTHSSSMTVCSLNHKSVIRLQTRDWNSWPLHFKHSHWWKRWSLSKFASHYTWGTNGVSECKRWCKVYMDSYVASNILCFMVTWTMFSNHLLEVGPTENREIMALRMHIVVGLFYFSMREDLHE